MVCSQCFRHVEQKSFLSRFFHMAVVQSDLWIKRWHLLWGCVDSHGMHFTFRSLLCFHLLSANALRGHSLPHCSHFQISSWCVGCVCFNRSCRPTCKVRQSPHVQVALPLFVKLVRSFLLGMSRESGHFYIITGLRLICNVVFRFWTCLGVSLFSIFSRYPGDPWFSRFLDFWHFLIMIVSIFRFVGTVGILDFTEYHFIF